MRIATHNVNSIRTRVGRVVEWLERSKTDVLAMQEIKCKPEQFPVQAFNDLGYQVTMHGLNQWNGVAFAHRIPAEEVEIDLFAGIKEVIALEPGQQIPSRLTSPALVESAVEEMA